MAAIAERRGARGLMMGSKLVLRVLMRLTQPPVLTIFASLHALGMLAVAVRYLASLHGTTDAGTACSFLWRSRLQNRRTVPVSP